MAPVLLVIGQPTVLDYVLGITENYTMFAESVLDGARPGYNLLLALDVFEMATPSSRSERGGNGHQNIVW